MKRMWSIILTAGFISITAAVCAQDTEADKKRRDNRGNEAINSNKATPTKIIEFIVGNWQIEDVYQGNQRVSATDTLGGEQAYEFDREGRYAQFTGNEKVDSGSYRLNEQHNLLYLESDDGSIPEGWKVTFSEDGRMFLRKIDDSAHAENYKYVYRRRSGGRQRD